MLYQVLGYIATGLVFATFWMKVPIRLRQVAIGSNVAFIAYASVGHLFPILLLHSILLPLNIVRLLELQRLTAKIKRAVVSDLSVDWLRPMMKRKSLGGGEFIFRRGEQQRDIYFVVAGTIRLVEIDVTVGAGELLGEMAVFSPTLTRTMSARCETPVELLAMPSSELLKLYYQNPDFGVYLVRLIARRLIQDIELIGQIGIDRTQEIKRQRHIAKIDETTGLGDREAIEERLVAEWSRGSRTPAPLTLLALRMSGESVGEVEIARVGSALSSCLSRASDFLGRDGDEFVAILPNTDGAAAVALGAEIREALAAPARPYSFSLGIATQVPQRGAESSSLLEQARRAA